MTTEETKKESQAWKKELVIRCGADGYVAYKYLRYRAKQFRKQGVFYHSTRQIADGTGLTHKKTRVALEKLVQQGYLVLVDKKGLAGSARWQVIPPDQVNPQPNDAPEKPQDAQKGA